MILHGVQPEELDKYFPHALLWLGRIPRLFDRVTACDIYNDVKNERWQLWCILDDGQVIAVVLTTITAYPLSRELILLGVSGRSMARWIGLISIIEKYARDNKCDRITAFAVRKGFSRVLKKYQTNKVYLEYEL